MTTAITGKTNRIAFSRAGIGSGGGTAGLARTQKPVPQGCGLLRARVPLCGVGQVLRRVQAEELEEQRRRAVQDGAELRTAGLLDQPAVGEGAGGGLARHAA